MRNPVTGKLMRAPPYEYSPYDCNTCEPSLWANGKTPKKVVCTIADITQCSAPNECSYSVPPDGDYILTQHSIYACYWKLDWYGDVGVCPFIWSPAYSNLNPVNSFMMIGHGTPGAACFYSYRAGETCITSFVNDKKVGDCGSIVCGYGGSVEITW